MRRTERTCVIANPSAGRGKAKRLLSEIRSRFAGITESNVALTTARGDEEGLAVRAIDDHCTTIIVVGGDGTCSQVAGAILQRRSRCRLAVVPCGTGNDFAKTLGVSDYSPADIAELVEQGETSAIDIGVVDGHYFLNSCGFGFDASVLEATKRVRFLRGDAVYIYSALAQLFTYRGIAVSADGAAVSRGRNTLMVTVSNGQWLGGAFRIAPQASVTDGELDVGFFRDSNIFDRAKLFAGAFRGTHLGMPSVKTSKMRSITLTFSEPPSMEVDGELLRARSASVKIACLPRALRVVAAPGAIR